MGPQKELKLAHSLAIVLLIVGVLSFAAFPAKTPDEPLRIMYKSVAGKSLFDHKIHAADTAYALACQDCHHHYVFEGSAVIDEEKEPVVQLCADCHPYKPKELAYPESCMECHDEEDLDEDIVVTERTDAFHDQCENCHLEINIGPIEERCAWCHVM